MDNEVKLPAIPDTNSLLLSSSKIERGGFDHHQPGISDSKNGNICQQLSSFKSLPHLENSVSSSFSFDTSSSEDVDIVQHPPFFKLPQLENSVSSSSSFNISSLEDGHVIQQPSFFKASSHLKKSVASSFKLPAFSHLKLLHHTSTFKDTPLGYRPYISRKSAGNERVDLQIIETAEGITEDEERKKPVNSLNSPQFSASSDDKFPGSRQSRTESDCSYRSVMSSHLVNQSDEKLSVKYKTDAERRSIVLNKVERFERLMKVLSLLKESKALEEFEVAVGENRECGGNGGLDAMREHIKSALDEAIRLRMETDPINY